MTDNVIISITTTTSAANSNIPCRIMKLPPELRQLIYDYYFADRKLPKTRKTKTHIDLFNRIEIRSTGVLGGYFGLLHHSSGVRAENVAAIYRAKFAGVWILCYVDGHTTDAQQPNGELKRVKDMCSLIREIDKDIVFGLHFAVTDHSRSVLLRFIDSFFGMQAEGEEHLKPEYVYSASHWGERTLTSSTLGICYSYWTMMRRVHEFWMFGSLARLDWSKFYFEFPTPKLERIFHLVPSREGSVEGDGEVELCRADEEHDTGLGSEDEISDLDCEDDHEDDEDEQEDRDDGKFTAEDGVVLLDAEVNGVLTDSGDESARELVTTSDGEDEIIGLGFDDEERAHRDESTSAAGNEAALLATEDKGSLLGSEGGVDVLDDEHEWSDLGF
ncbi:hypothetical protein MBLNU13_g07765t2 [Cladosporium sp. NU13]